MALTDKLTAIADAIRTKTGKTDALTLAQMPGEIEGIQTGSAPDGTDVTFGCVKQTVVISVPSGKAYYNGVLLPKIPDDVLAQYPFALVYKHSSGGYRLIACTHLVYWYPRSEYPTCVQSAGNANIYKPSTDASTWEFLENNNPLYFITPEIVWSNHDIPNGSATATDIYFAGSEPVTEIEDSILCPVEREEAYAIESESLNALGAVTQKMAGKKTLMTVADMVYWLNRVAFIPQGHAENTSSVSQISSAVGIVPTVYRGTAISTQSVFNFSNAVGSLESA